MDYTNKVSYSQYSMWSVCPRRWKLRYIDKIKIDTPNIHAVFASAMHSVIQLYLAALYSNGASFADSLELTEMLKEKMSESYRKEKNNYEEKFIMDAENVSERKKQLDEKFEKFVSKQEMIEFYYDGEKILDWFLKNRREYFNSVEEELIGFEHPIEEKLKEKLDFIAYLDVLLRNKKTNKLRVVDLKFTTKGWGSWKKNDSNTTDQLVIYKAFYAKKFNINLSDIDIEFLIFKRKLYEDIPYKQKRVLKFVPASGKPTINKTMERFNTFVNLCFDDDGNYRTDGVFLKVATENNCRYCQFNGRSDLCDKKN